MIDVRDIPVANEHADKPDPPGSLQFLEATQLIMNQQHLSMPSSVEEALNLYIVLITTIEERFNE